MYMYIYILYMYICLFIHTYTSMYMYTKMMCTCTNEGGLSNGKLRLDEIVCIPFLTVMNDCYTHT